MAYNLIIGPDRRAINDRANEMVATPGMDHGMATRVAQCEARDDCLAALADALTSASDIDKESILQGLLDLIQLMRDLP